MSKVLQEYDFSYLSGNIPGKGTSILEKVHDKTKSTVYHINLEKKQISYSPVFEIYGKDSFVRNDTKYNYYKQQLISVAEMKEKVIKNESSISM